MGHGSARARVGRRHALGGGVAVPAAADAALMGAKPMTDNGYKVQIARTAVKRAILKAAGLKVV